MNFNLFSGGGSDVGQGEFIQAWSKQDEDYYSNMPPPPPELQHHLSGSESPPPPPLPSSMPPTFTGIDLARKFDEIGLVHNGAGGSNSNISGKFFPFSQLCDGFFF